jgi:hypothetical protein
MHNTYVGPWAQLALAEVQHDLVQAMQQQRYNAWLCGQLYALLAVVPVAQAAWFACCWCVSGIRHCACMK